MGTEVRQLFKSKDLRCTRQRADVYAALAATKCHPTADELHSTLSARGCCMSLATVYNTLEALCKGGMCRKLTPASGPARFDADTTDHVHIMVDDGRILDAPEEINERLAAGLPKELRDELERQLGLSIRELRVSVRAAAR
ncbi:MAG: transcriptional repressor [Phycisphaerales bacterium]|nr:transcriptional repressor [Phycisphaerales bacterium]